MTTQTKTARSVQSGALHCSLKTFVESSCHFVCLHYETFGVSCVEFFVEDVRQGKGVESLECAF